MDHFYQALVHFFGWFEVLQALVVLKKYFDLLLVIEGLVDFPSSKIVAFFVPLKLFLLTR